MTEIAQLPPHQMRNASLRAESYNEADNTIEIVWTTGAPVMRYDWDGPYTETLVVSAKAVRLGRLNAGAPFLNTHSSYDLNDIIGCVAPGTARIDGNTGVCRIQLSTNPDRAGVIGDIRGGVIRNVSVGYLVHQMTRTEAQDGQTASCVVTDWEPIEISAVPIPADASAQIRSADAKVETHPCVVTRELVPVDPVLEARAAETARTQGILKIARQLKLPAPVVTAALDGNTTLEAFRALAIDAAGEPVNPAVESTGRAAEPAPSTPETPAAIAVAPTGELAMSDRSNETVMEPVVPATPVAETARAAPVDVEAVRRAAREAETARVQEIMRTARKMKLPEEFASRAVDGNTSIDAFRVLAIDEVYAIQERTAPQHFAPVGSTSDAAHRTYAEPKVALPKGTDATRIMTALAATRGDRRAAADFAERNYGTSGMAITRALSTSIGTAGGFLVPPEMSSEVIELLRPASVVMSLGPRIMPMPAGNMSVPRQTGGASATYAGENQPTLASQPTFGMIQLSAKKLVAIVPMSNEMIKYPSISTDEIVRADMVKAIAQRADLAFIRGDGTGAGPRGLRSFAAATALGGTNIIAANPVVNLANITADCGKLELALEQANIMVEKPGWIMSPRTKTYLMNLRDGLGNLIYATEMAQGRFRGAPFRMTTQVLNNLGGFNSDGTTPNTTASEIYYVDFAEVIIGEAYGLELEVFNGGAYLDSTGAMVSGIASDQTVMRAIVQHDFALRQEAAAAVLTGVEWF